MHDLVPLPHALVAANDQFKAVLLAELVSDLRGKLKNRPSLTISFAEMNASENG